MGNNFTLFQIDDRLASLVDEETGEIVDIEAFDALVMERDEKVKGIAMAYKNLCAEAEAINAQKRIFADRESALKRRMESCKRYLEYALHGEGFKSTEVCCRYRKTDAVEIDDIHAIPSEYLKVQEPEASKDAIKRAIKAGIDVPGARLETRMSLSVV